MCCSKQETYNCSSKKLLAMGCFMYSKRKRKNLFPYNFCEALCNCVPESLSSSLIHLRIFLCFSILEERIFRITIHKEKQQIYIKLTENTFSVLSRNK